MKARGSAPDPLWYKDAIIYETHVKAFYDSNNDGIGDFAGLVDKLDYLSDLGVTCLWVLPFYPSPLRDDGYDISDYMNVHPSYGSLEDFKAFIQAAHERGLQVITELVVNHTSDEHAWFQAARKAPPGSPERARYVWSDTDRKYAAARIIFTDTEKSNWSWDAEAKAYYWHRFFSHQPDLNFDNPSVIEDILGAMRFWLDQGVDGMRLDAVPYLVEREGTHCENLAETHAVIKRIRAELDQHYTNRMLLAEANQWPTDVRPYFGEGDECHSAFHFPLMPRMFMALRLEDRHPITEILSQTPEIPDICQWALFLRNHDELTLEMVTDEERDYMYFAYSADPRMRLNVGIRRRLAPLMENNRRRVELLNSLLFSFPGTPIIYYGDEIGMGDNIYLGDRNGVRTPMQWSADRNAGFSRANPARLYSPVIMDPVYGYEAINVEAQHSDSSSLLSWMRNMISLRKLFKVFGRGSIEFLRPANRKVLVYLREYHGDRVLCVANLSRFAQAAEVDLGRFEGMTPVEMLGYTDFPPIERAPYRLTLGPYGFYWFELHGVPKPISVRLPAEEHEEVAALALGAGWESLREDRVRLPLEREILPRFLPEQRWFGAKARTIAAIRLRDVMPLGEDFGGPALSFWDVDYEGGGQEAYLLPLSIARDGARETIERDFPKAVLHRVSLAGAEGVLYDATVDRTAAQILLSLIENGRDVDTGRGRLHAFSTGALDAARGPGREPLEAVRGSAEQSNTSIRFGNRLFMKLFRRLEPGPNPDLEIGLHLTGHQGFSHVPACLGAIEYEASGEATTTVAMLQALVPNQGDGWQWTLEELARYFESCAAHPRRTDIGALDGHVLDMSEREIPPHAREILGIALDAACTLGKRTAELHLALADSEDPAFAPEPFSEADLGRLAAELNSHAVHVLDQLVDRFPQLPDEVLEPAGLVLAYRRRLLERFRRLDALDIRATKTRIHGDYHLGQVLWAQNDYVILDFEGEPARPLAERRAKASPLRDVAGMLRSFSYAVHSALDAHRARRPDEADRLRPWAAFWERWISAGFVKAYRATAGTASFVPADRTQLQALLEAFLMHKAVYELSYEMNHRPAWIGLPLSGLTDLMAR